VDERDEIRARIDLVELVRQRVALKRVGKNWKGLCPFHNDRNPSFHVNPDLGFYRCWSCGEKGDVFTWVMKTQNVEFREALELLARQAGVTLKPRSGESSKEETDRRAAAMEDALRYFVSELQRNRAVLDYCEGRGLTEDVVKDWELGYAPDVGEALAVHLQKKGHTLALCAELFLVAQDASGGYGDKFKGRLMFPIRDERGALVAFGGRIVGDGQPKYINSGDTPLYRKSRVLYGLHRAKQKLLATRHAVIVEGYLDLIACHRAGLEEAVATLGTAMAEDQARLLKRWCDKATILYDGDEPGQKSAERACEVLRLAGVQAEVALSPEGDDPDSLLRREGPKAVQDLVSGGISPLAFTLRRIEGRESPDSPAFWAEASAALAACDSPREVDRHVTELAAKHMKTRSEAGARATIFRMIARHQAAPRRYGAKAPAMAVVEVAAPKMTPAESLIFRAFLEESLRATALEAMREPGLLSSESAKGLATGILEAFGKKAPKGPPKSWIGDVPEELQEQLADIHFFAGHRVAGAPVEEPATAEALDLAVESLRKLRETRRLEDMRSPEAGDEHLKKIMELSSSIKGRYEYSEDQKERRVKP
jgi:DNA primase